MSRSLSPSRGVVSTSSTVSVSRIRALSLAPGPPPSPRGCDNRIAGWTGSCILSAQGEVLGLASGVGFSRRLERVAGAKATERSFEQYFEENCVRLVGLVAVSTG